MACQHADIEMVECDEHGAGVDYWECLCGAVFECSCPFAHPLEVLGYGPYDRPPQDALVLIEKGFR